MQQHMLEVETDEGITGRVAPTSIDAYQLSILKTHAIGESPFARERLYQMLFKGTRWVYQQPGWFGEFDNCLWDIAGKAAGLPIFALIGRVRERLPVYLTAGDMDLPGLSGSHRGRPQFRRQRLQAALVQGRQGGHPPADRCAQGGRRRL